MKKIHGYQKTSQPTAVSSERREQERAGSSIEPGIEESTHVKTGKTNKNKQERENTSSIRSCKGTLKMRIVALIAAAGTSPQMTGDRRS